MVTFKDLPEQFSAQSSLIITGVAALMLGIVGTKVVTGRAPAEPVASPPVAAPVIESVTALGRLTPNGETIRVSAPSSNDGSRIEELRVNEGDRVTKGQVIAVLNSQPRLQAALSQAQGQVRVTEAKLAQVQSGAKSGEIAAQRSEIARLNAERTGDYNTQSAVVGRLEAELAGVVNTQVATRKRLQADYDNALQEADRYEQLFVAGATSASLRDNKRLAAQTALRKGEEAYSEANRVQNTLKQQITEAKAALDRSTNSRGEQVDAAASTLDQIAEVRPVDVQTAQAEIAQAQAAMAKAAADLEQAYVRAPQAGTVLKIHTRAGEKIATEGVINLGQTQQMMALVEVYESDVPRIKLGQSANVMSDAIGQELTGKVREIGQNVLRQNVVNTDPTSNTDARVMEVRIELDAASSEKVAKFTNSQVTAKIITAASN
jgi:HlyD family secretion protein